VCLVYSAMAGICAGLWAVLHESLQPPLFGTVWVRFCANESNTSGVSPNSAPAELKMKLLAVYLAEDINITTQVVLRPRGDRDAKSLISTEQSARRVWTFPACDPGGRDEIGSADVWAPWKYVHMVNRFDMDLASVRPNPIAPMKHEVPVGVYHFAVFQTCLQNLGRANLYQVKASPGSTTVHSWGGSPPNRTRFRMGQPSGAALSPCFQLTQPLASPLVISHGDDVTVTMAYSLQDSFRFQALGDEGPAWSCYAPEEGDGDPIVPLPSCLRRASAEACSKHCVRLPKFYPTFHRRGPSEKFSPAMVPPDMLCHSWRYTQAIAGYQACDRDNSETLIYTDEFDCLFAALAVVNILPTRAEIDRDNDLKASYEEFVAYLDAAIGFESELEL